MRKRYVFLKVVMLLILILTFRFIFTTTFKNMYVKYINKQRNVINHVMIDDFRNSINSMKENIRIFERCQLSNLNDIVSSAALTTCFTLTHANRHTNIIKHDIVLCKNVFIINISLS